MGKRKISAIIVSHNRKSVIGSVKSAFNQDFPESDFEVIVIADKTIEGLDEFKRYTNFKLHYVDIPEPGPKWAIGVENSEGDILCFLDDDDEWVRDKLKTVYQIFQDNLTLTYYHNNHVSVDENTKVIPNYPELRHYHAINKIGYFTTISNESSRNQFQLFSTLGAPFNNSCISIKKEVVLPLLGYLKKGKWMVDYFLFYCNMVNGKDIIVDSRQLTLYRRRAGNGEIQMDNIHGRVKMYERYEESHLQYLLMSKGTPLEPYLKWVVAKISLMKALFGKEVPRSKEFNDILEVVRNVPLADSNSILSSLILSFVVMCSFISRNVSDSLLVLMDHLGLSLL